MSRTDDDTWDVTEGVGATALGVAWARSLESSSAQPLFVDPHARQFLDAAAALGWTPPSGAAAERIKSIGGYAASRTKWFDDFFVSAMADGITQAVILAAGLDARGWRLPWPAGSTVFEIDQPRVLQFKTDTMRAVDARSSAQHVAVPIDLRQDWPKALRDAGFDDGAPTAWTAEGLLPYLPAAGQDLLFERLASLSAPGSRVAVESFGAGFFDPDYLAERREKIRRAREEAGEPEGPDVADLWFIEERTDVSEWLAERGWETSVVDAADLMRRYGRDTSEVALRTAFVEGRLAAQSPAS